MTLSPDQDRTHESIINGELARFLRDRCGLDAVAETLLIARRLTDEETPTGWGPFVNL